MLEKTRKFVSARKGAFIIGLSGLMPLGAYALPSGGDASNGINSSISTIVQWIQWAGIAIAFFGVVQLILAFQRDDSEGKSRAIHTLITGGMLALAGTFAGYFGLGNSTGTAGTGTAKAKFILYNLIRFR